MHTVCIVGVMSRYADLGVVKQKTAWVQNGFQSTEEMPARRGFVNWRICRLLSETTSNKPYKPYILEVSYCHSEGMGSIVSYYYF